MLDTPVHASNKPQLSFGRVMLFLFSKKSSPISHLRKDGQKPYATASTLIEI
jgi:hypothetical protein